ncbi:glycoside hydrolase family 75 protein [Caballeronia sordidicola]|uniref:glycoside hydrolase family 75 protein n=1 Tax=Caballeronia sordidicola TaxID=196367 RepID=UPI00094EF481|nr:glycoside hydrolase family 75 protein [Caballeronia sordidicola]
MSKLVPLTLAVFVLWATTPASAVNCLGRLKEKLGGTALSMALDDGGLMAFAKMNINIDGSGKAYHRQNRSAGVLIHLCNAGDVYLPTGKYTLSKSNRDCTERFMADLSKIEAAGWGDPKVGAIHWYGILGEGSTVVGNVSVNSIRPVTSAASSFYVSPTKLFDATIENTHDQKRYVDPLIVNAAVAPPSIRSYAPMGSFGVAINRSKRIAVPFVVGDSGPRIGEGSVALARKVAGLPEKTDVTYAERDKGQVSDNAVLLVSFGRKYGTGKYDSNNPRGLNNSAEEAYESWGGAARLHTCIVRAPRN